MELPFRPFEAQNYRDFLDKRLPISGPSRGQRTRLAEALGVQGAFISQVLRGKLDLSLEQATKTAEFLELGEEESDYFLLLVHHARAGSEKLRAYYQEKLNSIIARRKEIQSRVKSTEQISESDQAKYFSSWIYGAIHAALTIPELQTRQALAKRLRLPMKVIDQYLDFLIGLGIAEQNSDKIQAGKTRIHINNANPNILKHHSNWRTRCLQALERQEEADQHYTCVMSISRKDAEKIKSMWLEFLSKIEPVITASPEEEIFGITWDLFRL